MTIEYFKETNSSLYDILLEMFKRVNADLDLELTSGWFSKYSWSKEDEDSFKSWLSNYVKDKKIWYALTNRIYLNKKLRERFANDFVFQYGWKIN